MTAEGILAEWAQKKFSPIYWLEGEEEYYIDKLVQEAERNILAEAEAAFNKTIFYGRDTQWADVVNACRRYPMFADKQLIIIKEAQHLKEIDKLEPYFAQPLPSTILIIAYKEKKLDARTRFAKTVKEKAVIFAAKKLYDNQLPAWVTKKALQLGFRINDKAVALLVDHIGNDLSRIENEIEKITINLKGEKNITEAAIEQYIGISKDFNVYELQSAIAEKNMPKAIRIIQYFAGNPKAGPIQLVLPSLYGFFSKAYMLLGTTGTDDARAKQIGVNAFFYKSYAQAVRNYGHDGVEKILLLLHQYSLKSVGIHSVKTSDAELMKEMVVKMMAIK